jgi:spore coat protein U-like protein
MATYPSPLRHALAAPAILVLCGGGLPFLQSEARAETSANFDVTAAIVPGCLVDGLGSAGNAGTIGTLDFGHDTSLSAASHSATTTASQSIRLRCTPGVNLSMSIDGGTHSASGARNLQLGADTAARIVYRVCRDAACNLPIAIGGTASTVVTAANANDVRLPVYAALTLPGHLPPGTYTDTLTVTLTW